MIFHISIDNITNITNILEISFFFSLLSISFLILNVDVMSDSIQDFNCMC